MNQGTYSWSLINTLIDRGGAGLASMSFQHGDWGNVGVFHHKNQNLRDIFCTQTSSSQTVSSCLEVWREQ